MPIKSSSGELPIARLFPVGPGSSSGPAGAATFGTLFVARFFWIGTHGPDRARTSTRGASTIKAASWAPSSTNAGCGLGRFYWSRFQSAGGNTEGPARNGGVYRSAGTGGERINGTVSSTQVFPGGCVDSSPPRSALTRWTRCCCLCLARRLSRRRPRRGGRNRRAWNRRFPILRESWR
jgi:hypothetical protein